MWASNTESCSWDSCREGNTETEEKEAEKQRKQDEEERIKSNLVIDCKAENAQKIRDQLSYEIEMCIFLLFYLIYSKVGCP